MQMIKTMNPMIQIAKKRKEIAMKIKKRMTIIKLRIILLHQ